MINFKKPLEYLHFSEYFNVCYVVIWKNSEDFETNNMKKIIKYVINKIHSCLNSNSMKTILGILIIRVSSAKITLIGIMKNYYIESYCNYDK